MSSMEEQTIKSLNDRLHDATRVADHLRDKLTAADARIAELEDEIRTMLHNQEIEGLIVSAGARLRDLGIEDD